MTNHEVTYVIIIVLLSVVTIIALVKEYNDKRLTYRGVQSSNTLGVIIILFSFR